MPSTIFAIYCYMLLFSKSGSALRIAEVDSYRANCDAKVNKKYKCEKICLKTTPSSTDQTTDNLVACLGKIQNDIKGITPISANGKTCQLLKSVEKSQGNCASGVPVYTLATSANSDPHVVNMAGEKFDILATGAFSLLSLTRATEEDLMINGTIARFGAKCGESFITHLENTGGWIRKAYNTEALKVRAVQDAPKQQALQINFGQNWEPISNLQEMAHLSKAA